MAAIHQVLLALKTLIPFTDGFDLLDTSKWIFTNSTDVTISSTSSELQLAADSAFSGGANGGSAISVPTFDFTGKAVEITFPSVGTNLGRNGTGVGGITWLRVYDTNNANNYAYMYSDSDIIGTHRSNNGTLSGATTSDPLVQAGTKWRITHNNPANTWSFAYWNGSSWVTQFTSAAASWNPTSTKIYILGWISTSNQQSVTTRISDLTTDILW